MTKLDPNFIWSIADLLRGPYRPRECGTVILPFTVLARLNAVLVPTKEAVLAAYQVAYQLTLTAKGNQIESVDKEVARKAAVKWVQLHKYNISSTSRCCARCASTSDSTA